MLNATRLSGEAGEALRNAGYRVAHPGERFALGVAAAHEVNTKPGLRAVLVDQHL